MATTATLALPYPVGTDTPDVPRDIKALADRLEIVIPTQPTQHVVGAAGEPTFGNLWANYGGGYTTLRFWKTREGVVFLDGVVKNTGTATGAVIQLPTGFRPAATSMFLLPAGAGALQVEISSLIIPTRYLASGTADWVSFGGVCFMAGA